MCSYCRVYCCISSFFRMDLHMAKMQLALQRLCMRHQSVSVESLHGPCRSKCTDQRKGRAIHNFCSECLPPSCRCSCLSLITSSEYEFCYCETARQTCELQATPGIFPQCPSWVDTVSPLQGVVASMCQPYPSSLHRFHPGALEACRIIQHLVHGWPGHAHDNNTASLHAQCLSAPGSPLPVLLQDW